MTRYFLTLGYDGTDFLGWQSQPTGRTVQGVLEDRLSILLRQEIAVTGAGRTDAGVHARWMACHADFVLPEGVTPPDLLFRANRFLPPDITLYGLYPVKDDAHARFDATERRYGYYVRTCPSPFGRHLQVTVPELDFAAMNEAAAGLIGTHDFTTYSKKHSNVHTHLCTVSEAEWQRIGPGEEWVFHISSNRFLRNMVRAIVGTLIEVGRGKISPEAPAHYLARQDRSLAATSAPAQGLFLEYIRYPLDLFVEADPYSSEEKAGTYRVGERH